MPSTHPASPTIDELFSNLVSIFRYLGIPEDIISASLSQAFSTTTSPEIPKQSDYTLTQDGNLLLSSILANWQLRPGFVDDKGEPIPIPVHGEKFSFDVLYDLTARHYEQGAIEIDASSAIERLIKHQSIEVGMNELLHLKMSSFASSTKARDGAHLQLSFINDYVRTAGHNVRHARQSGIFQRVANAKGFNADMIPLLNSILHEHGMQFLQMVDEFIEQHKVSDDPDHKPVDLGVGLYFYVRDDTSPDG